MKTEQEITATRKRLLDAAVTFGTQHNFPFEGATATHEELHYMALGALCFADDTLSLDVPHNLSRMMVALERENAL